MKIDNRKELTRLISAMVLGDGCLFKAKNMINVRYSFSQRHDHKDYFDWQCSVLENLTSISVYHYAESKQRRAYYSLDTKSHPFYTTLRERMYFDGRKTVSPHDLRLFDWQSAAVWYMDDGYILRSEDQKQRGNVFLCTDHYTLAEVIILQKVLWEKLGVPFDLRKRGHKKNGDRIHRLVLRSNNTARFLDGISKYVFPSFEYKLHTGSPTIVGDDIVCTVEESTDVCRNDIR